MEWWAIWPSSNWVTLLLGFGVLVLGAYVARRAFDAARSSNQIQWYHCGPCRRYHAQILDPNSRPCDGKWPEEKR